MALGTTIQATNSPTRGYEAVAPMSMSSGWQTIVAAGGVNAADAATITNPTTQIIRSTTSIFSRHSSGTYVALRLGYDASATIATNVVVKVFGRSDSNQTWDLLITKGSFALSAALMPASTDVTNGTLKYTTVTYDNLWDCLGTSEILVGIETALTVSVGTATTAIIQAKMI